VPCWLDPEGNAIGLASHAHAHAHAHTHAHTHAHAHAHAHAHTHTHTHTHTPDLAPGGIAPGKQPSQILVHRNVVIKDLGDSHGR
jgi:hypothetical protein